METLKRLTFSQFPLAEKIIIFCLGISLFGHVHYYFYPYVNDVGSLAPNYINYIFLCLSVIPLLAIGMYFFSSLFLKSFSRVIQIYFSALLVTIFLSFPSLHYLDKEFIKLILFIFLFASALGIEKKYSLRSLNFFLDRYFHWIVFAQCLFNFYLWLRRHELWLGRQVGFLGNPSMMGLTILISLSWLTLRNPQKKINLLDYALSVGFMVSLFITGAKFCTLLYPLLLIVALFVFFKALWSRLILFSVSFIILGAIALYSPIKHLFPPALISKQSNSYITRLQQFEQAPSPVKNVQIETQSNTISSTEVLPTPLQNVNQLQPLNPPSPSEFGKSDNQFLDLSKTLGVLPMIIILFPFLWIFGLRFRKLFNIFSLTSSDVMFVTILISFLVYRSIFYFPISLFLVFSAGELLTLSSSRKES